MPRGKKQPRIGIALPVLVRTGKPIDGQREHAAIITRDIGDGVVNVTLFPSDAEPYAITRVRHDENPVPTSTAVTWRFRP